MRIRLELDQLSFVGQGPQNKETDISRQFLVSLFDRHSEILRADRRQVEDRLQRVEALLQTQSKDLHSSQMSQIGPLYSPARPATYARPTLPLSPSSAQNIRTHTEAVRFRLRQQRSNCHPSCPCACHSVQRATTPSFMNRVLGQLFVGYAGLPMVSNKCDSRSCRRGQIPSVSVEYWFPLGFCWSQIVRLQLAYECNVGPSLQLSTLRRVSDSAQCVSYALDGNIEGLKNLFSAGLASPRDVSSTRGYSLLRVSTWALSSLRTQVWLNLHHAVGSLRAAIRNLQIPHNRRGGSRISVRRAPG